MKANLCLALWGLVASLSLSGCLKEKEDFIVNPDGSGKVTCETQAMLPQMGQQMDPNATARVFAQNRVNNSQGVTAWKDVSFSATRDGKVTFKGTAYFQDVAKLKFSNDTFSVRWKPVADGAVQLEFVPDLGNRPPLAEPPKLTEEEIVNKIAQYKAQADANSPRLSKLFADLRDLRMEWSFTLPGAPEKTVNFEKAADQPNTVRIVVEGPKLVEALKTFNNDDAYLRAMIAAGKNPAKPDPELLNEKLFGTKGPITVTFKPADKPLFDFAAESEAAKKAMPEMQKGLEMPVAPATPK